MTVSTAPPGATCTLDRMGARLGAIAQTPGSVRLDKSKNDLSVTCSKPGYQTATITRAPSFGGATFGNIIAGGVIGVVVDAASGANYEYPADIRLDLAAEGIPAAPPDRVAAADGWFGVRVHLVGGSAPAPGRSGRSTHRDILIPIPCPMV